jgi:transcriptional regulator with GAF, ATPase, and Fis domain
MNATVRAFKKSILQAPLQRADGNHAEGAMVPGVSASSVRKRPKRLNIKLR